MKAGFSWIVWAGLSACAGGCGREGAPPQPKVDVVRSEPSARPRTVSPSPPPAKPVAPTARANPSTAFADGRAALKARNFTAAAAAFEIACEEEGQLQACVALAGLLDSGRGVHEDPDRAKGLLQRACAADLQSACDQLGH